METIATVRVKPESDVADARPTRDLLDRAASLLHDRGFQVLRIGRFGVSIAGEAATFSRELGVEIEPGKPLAEAPKPRHAPLARLIDLVEVTTSPLSFEGPAKG